MSFELLFTARADAGLDALEAGGGLVKRLKVLERVAAFQPAA